MNIEEIISFAIVLENKSVEFYTELYNREIDKNLKITILNLINFEKSHVEELNKLKNNYQEEINQMENPNMSYYFNDYDLYQIDFKKIKNTKEMVLYAINDEVNANKLYIDLAHKFSNNSTAQKTLIKLANEEKSHKKHLQKIYRSLKD